MISGCKVYLRPIEKKDLVILNKWKNDEKVFKNLGGGFMPMSIDQQSNWIDNLIDQTGNSKRFIICKKDTDSSMGMIGLYDINYINRTSEIGLYIGEISYQGRGFSKESALLLEGFAREYLNLRKLKLNVVEDNTSGLGLWKSLDYKEVGRYVEDRYIKGEYKDLVLMEKFL